MSAKSAVIEGAAPAAQVNLLPPEVRASRSLRATQRVLALVVVGVIALCALGYVAGTMRVDAAEGELADARAETQRLLAQQAEYSEVPTVLGELQAAEQARVIGSSTEVLWAPYLRTLMATRPANVVFSDIRLAGATPDVPPPVAADPLESAALVRMDFSGIALTLPDVAAWRDSLETVDGFQDARVNSVAIAEGSEGVLQGVVHYVVTGSVQVTSEALALRFAEQED